MRKKTSKLANTPTCNFMFVNFQIAESHTMMLSPRSVLMGGFSEYNFKILCIDEF